MATPTPSDSKKEKDKDNAEVETTVPDFLAPPVLNKIRNEDVVARIRMERSVSQEIRDEKADLREAAEKSTTVILDLNLEGHVRWVSPSWKDVIGTDPLAVVGKPVASLMLDEGPIFENAAESMKLDDSKSQTVRCKIRLGKDSVFNKKQKDDSLAEEMESLDLDENGEDTILTLEGQGFMAHDRLTGGESHVMWMLRPFLGPREITIDLPELIVDTLGFGAEVLAQYLTSLVETNEDGNATEQDKTLKMPPPILCRICECQIQPWWFEKHSELCMQEHQADLEVQMTHETLTDQRASIVKVLDNLEEHRAGAVAPRDGSPTVAQAEYKGLPIGPKPTSPAHSTTRHGSRRNSLTSESRSHGNHSRVRSFAVRRPLARIVELILDLCDTAIEIKNPAVQNTPQNADDEVRTQSPGSESRISQVLQWQTPGSGTLDDEEGLAALVLDTENLARAKVEAVLRMQRILEYSEHIRVESQLLVEECIAVAMQKAEKIKEGNLSSSDSESTSATSDTEGEDTAETPGAHSALDSMDGLSAMASVFRSSHSPALSPHASRRQSLAMSTGSNSPLEASTPRSYSVASASLINKSAYPSKRASMFGGSDAGGESDASLASSVSVAPRNNSPGADINLARARSIRDRKRKSLKLPGICSPHRQPSPGRSTGPSSPLRVNKSRQAPPSAIDQHPLSPLTSPVMQPAPSPSDHRRQSSIFTSDIPKMPGSPRLGPVNQPQPRPAPPSIKDFDIVKAISKGAFGSVYLAKKKATGDYYAIKVLKKADMVAKNQVTNVKAERAIMMWQGESDFVAKLYWTFSSKDYLYLVMEYLNGGDCASLIKVLGGLPEDWAKKYLAEVILGVEHLHSRGVVHRDLKPDNLLIDAKGHLKLTDFGLSRMGLIGRQKRMLNSPPPAQNPDLMGQAAQARPLSMASSRSASFDFQSTHLSSVAPTPNTTPEILGPGGQHSYFSLARENSNGRNSPRRVSDQRSDSNGSDFLNMMFKGLTMEDIGKDKDKKDSSATPDDEQTSVTDSPEIHPLQQTQSNTSNLPVETPPLSTMLPPPMALFDPEDRNRRFVGTPDYLAPETINGSGQDEMSDWWSCGCIIFEFLFGYPPFHAETPELVFEKITTRKIDWPSHEDYLVSDEARNLMSRLMTLDPKERLGSNAAGKYKSGGEEIRAHPWFDSINWDTLLEDEAQFVPAPENPEDTEYFDTRGATLQTFAEEVEDQKSSPGITPGGGPDYERPHDALTRSRSSMHSVGLKRNLMPLHIPPHVRDSRSRRLSEPVPPDDFGSFNYKNLPILEKANKDVINKLRQEALQAQAKSNAAAVGSASPAPSIDTGSPLLPSALQRRLSAYKGSTRSVSPAALSSVVSPPSRPSQPTSPMLVQFSVGTHHERRKTSSSSSATSASWQTPSLIPEFPKLGTSVSGPPTNPSPMKTRPTSMLVGSPDKNLAALQRVPSGAGPQTGRHRSHTLGSQDGGEPTGSMPPPTSTYQHSKRRSQVFDVSPSSSDNEDPRQKALLRVQRRRQSSRRMSRFSLADGPVFRPLDILVCEDHPVSRLVMDRLLEKLHCRTISVVTGPDALRVASSEVQFDIIMMEVKLPQLSGTDVAKMIRATKNVNQQTPILAVTGYLKELPQDHHFDSLIEKPPTLTKLREQLINLCHWKPAPPGWRPGRESPQFSAGSPPISSSLRQESHLHNLATAQMPLHVLQDDSPSSTSSGPFARLHLDSVRTGSIDDSISSTNMSMLDDMIDPNESVIVTRPSGGDGEKWHSGAGLGILDDHSYYPSDFTHPGLPHLLHFNSAPPRLGITVPSPRKSRHEDPATRGRRGASGKDVLAGLSTSGADSGDDDDDADTSPRFQVRSPPFTGTASTPALRKAATTSPPLPPMGPIRPNFPRKSKLGTQLLRTDTSGAVISASQEQLSKDAMLSKMPAQLTSSQSEPGPVLETVEEHPFPMLHDEADADVEADSSGLLSPPEKFIPDAQLVGHSVKEVDIHTLSPPLAGRPLTPLTSAAITPSPLQEATSLAPSPAPESPNPTL